MNLNIPTTSSNQDSLISESADQAPTYKEIQSASKEAKIEELRKVRLYPVFNDEKLAQISINYWLYLEIFRVAINLLISALAVTLITQGLCYLIVPNFLAIESYPQAAIFIILAILLANRWVRAEKLLMNHPYISQYQWSENLFSIVVENIPVKCTKEEVKEIFENMNSMKLAKGSIKQVILVKEFSVYAKLRRKHKELAEKLDNTTDKKNIKKLGEEMKKLEKQLYDLEVKSHNSNTHKGAAIVIFNSMFTKNLVYNRLAPSIVRTIDRYLAIFSKNTQLNEQSLDAVELPEPQDLVIENISYPSIIRDFRKLIFIICVIVLTLSMVMVENILVGMLASYKNLVLEQKTEDDDKILVQKVIPYLISLAIIIANSASNFIYKYLNMLNVYLSDFQSKKNLIQHAIRSAIINYLIVQIMVVFLATKATSKDFDETVFVDQFIKTIIMYCIKTVGKKLGFAFINSPAMKSYGTKPKNVFGKLLSLLQNKSPEFDYAGGVGAIIPILVMSFGSLMMRSFVFLPVSIISLYLIAIIDKYSITRSCEPFSLNSAHYMLTVFQVAKWCPTYFFIGTLCMIAAKGPTVVSKTSSVFWPITLCAFFGYFVFLCLTGFPTSIKNQFKEKFVKENWRSNYDLVCHNFKSFFKRVDYSFQIEEKLATLEATKAHENKII